MKKLIKHFIIFYIFILFPTFALSAPGDLDLTFNGTGKATINFGDQSDARAIAIQADNKIVVAGRTFSSANNEGGFAIARYNTDGLLDTTFDDDGKVITLSGSTAIGAVQALAIQTDGRILAAGSSTSNSGVIIRYNSNGSIDTTFGLNGLVTMSFGANTCRPLDMALQSDGKIVITGTFYEPNIVEKIATIRYNQNGSLDTSFDSDGIAIIHVGQEFNNGRSVAIHPNGKIFVAANSYTETAQMDFTVVSYNQNGSLNTEFDSDGVVTTDVNNTSQIIRSLVIQADGKILVAGVAGSGDLGLLARYNLNGTLDTSLDTDGLALTSQNTVSISLQNDGKIITAGSKWNTTNYDFVLGRYNSDGSLDNSFSNSSSFWGTNGQTTIDFFATNDQPLQVKVDSFGRVLVAGYTHNPNQMFAIARLQNLAPTAANASIKGKVTTQNGRGIANAVITLQSDISTETRYARTNSFGYYSFENLQVGANYILTIHSKRYRFSNANLFISLNEDFTEANFTAD